MSVPGHNDPRADLYQPRLFSVRISTAYKQSLIKYAVRQGVHFGVFFDTSGRVHCERVNPRAQYPYLFRTDAVKKSPLRKSKKPAKSAKAVTGKKI